MAKTLTLVFLFVGYSLAVESQYKVPSVEIQAASSGEVRVYIPDWTGTTFFAFHANINEDIEQQEPGSLNGEVKSKTGDFWVLESNQQLKVGDVVNYWIFVNVNRAGYRKTGSWEIKELLESLPPLPSSCTPSATLKNGGIEQCSGSIIINDEFNEQSVDRNLWIVEHRIPTYAGPDFEFNSYKDIDDTRFIKDGKLYLKPHAIINELEVRGTLNLTDKCTSKDPNQCVYRQVSSFLLPPIKSAKIRSKVSFKYGKVEVRAKLPAGDWIYPIIALESKDKPEGENSPKIWVAYSRGNDHLRGGGSDDYGSRLLFGGPVLGPSEPERSQRLSTKLAKECYSDDFHLYTLEWTPDKMLLYVDSLQYGEIPVLDGFTDLPMDVRYSEAGTPPPFDREYVLSLGVAVGGLNDFPDGFVSENDPKPWINTERNYIKNFFDARDVWLKTWKGDKVAMQIDYVKVTAL